MKFIHVLFAGFMLALLPTFASAGYHSAPITDGLVAFGIPLWIASPLAVMADNGIHFVNHITLTVQTVATDPMGALFMLNQIGESCFAGANAPWIHVLFLTGFTALLTTLSTLALVAMLVWKLLPQQMLPRRRTSSLLTT